ncbi:MAG: acetyltransferase [Desulfobulbaceae bacterium]|nr:acetyltransferase [Desulfobulbaceae bacterium]
MAGKKYDVFNGDADGICALHQLRLADPCDAELVTGVKRDIKLLAKLGGIENAALTVLDISMNSNMEPLQTLLSSCTVFYVDHHFAGDIPNSANLTAHIDPSPDVCTSLIVDRILGGKFSAWAVVAAFGDNLHDAARKVAAGLALAEDEVLRLRELGELMNYNGYGKTMADLHFTPQELYLAVKPYADPFEFCARSTIPAALREGFNDDFAKARAVLPLHDTEHGRIYQFPGQPWARRVAGVFSNEKAREMENKAHALMVDNNDGTLMVSVRAPLNRRQGADNLCLSFPTGGGRAGAAGINALPLDQVDKFFESFSEVFSG